jgi:dTDP-4-amino-4,6-dideoxygalactose transaminase
VYHQYTLKIKGGRRDELKEYLQENGVPCMVYYPLPLQKQKAFENIAIAAEKLDIAENLSGSVLSLPIHTEMEREVQDFIVDKIGSFFKR